MRLFRDKAQVEELKNIEKILPEAILTETMQLKLAAVRITYSVSLRNTFEATIEYCERPTDYGNQGTSKKIEFTADSWSELIDKVIDHFMKNYHE